MIPKILVRKTTKEQDISNQLQGGVVRLGEVWLLHLKIKLKDKLQSADLT